MNQWGHVTFQCLPANLHNIPDKIPGEVLKKIETERQNFTKIFVAYADCGTGGLLDKALAGTGIERLPGAHCYEFFAGSERFHQFADEEPGSFYLTDFLTRHFQRLVIKSLGLDQRPELMPLYFGNYKRVVYLAQTESEELQLLARAHADVLGLEYRYHYCGDQPFERLLKAELEKEEAWQK